MTGTAMSMLPLRMDAQGHAHDPYLAMRAQALPLVWDKLIAHPIYGFIGNVDAVRVFMENHVFAVGGFHDVVEGTAAVADVRRTALDTAQRTRKLHG